MQACGDPVAVAVAASAPLADPLVAPYPRIPVTLANDSTHGVAEAALASRTTRQTRRTSRRHWARLSGLVAHAKAVRARTTMTTSTPPRFHGIPDHLSTIALNILRNKTDGIGEIVESAARLAGRGGEGFRLARFGAVLFVRVRIGGGRPRGCPRWT